LDTMDQAESLVFWLGGFPSPIGSDNRSVSSSKLCGFNGDKQYPFRLAIKPKDPADIVDNRIDIGLFPFEEGRLVDRDGDGWWEYIPRLPAGTQNPAPYVYFDAALYTLLRNR